jgi:hypothetical protein
MDEDFDSFSSVEIENISSRAFSKILGILKRVTGERAYPRILSKICFGIAVFCRIVPVVGARRNTKRGISNNSCHNGEGCRRLRLGIYLPLL